MARRRLNYGGGPVYRWTPRDLLVGTMQRSNAREHLVPSEPYAAALCGARTDGTKDATTDPDAICARCFKAWRDARGGSGTGTQLWIRGDEL